ncbi:hypothetical protein ACJX0J_040631, partial [Zea mays]
VYNCPINLFSSIGLGISGSDHNDTGRRRHISGLLLLSGVLSNIMATDRACKKSLFQILNITIHERIIYLLFLLESNYLRDVLHKELCCTDNKDMNWQDIL